MAASTSFTVLTPFRQANPCSMGPVGPPARAPTLSEVPGALRASLVQILSRCGAHSLSSRGWTCCAPCPSLLRVSVCVCAGASASATLRSHVMCDAHTVESTIQPAGTYSAVQYRPSIARHSTLSRAGQVPSMLFRAGTDWIWGWGLGLELPGTVQRGWTSVDG